MLLSFFEKNKQTLRLGKVFENFGLIKSSKLELVRSLEYLVTI